MAREEDGVLASALDDLILGRGVARGRHELAIAGRDVTELFRSRLAALGFAEMTVREAPIEPGERIPGFLVDGGEAEFGYFRWEIFTPRWRRKLFASERRDPATREWSIQVAIGSPRRIWGNPSLRERHDVDVVVAVVR